MKFKQKIAFIQAEIEGLSKKADNPFFHSKYVELNQILDALNPLLREQELLLTLPLTHVNGRPAITLRIEDLAEEADDIVEETVVIPDLVDSQKMGSAITYFRRYCLMSYFNFKAEDDDGNLAIPPKEKVAVGSPKVAIPKVAVTKTVAQTTKPIKNLKNFKI